MPDEEPDAISSTILEEIEDEIRWREAFAKSQDVLSRLAEEARAEIARGDVVDFDPAFRPK